MEGERSGKGDSTKPWLGKPELVLIRPGWTQEKSRGNLAMALQLARCVLPVLLHARSSSASEQRAQMHGPEPRGVFLPHSLGSLGTVWEHRLGYVNCSCRTPCPLQGTLAGQDMALILF